MRFWLKNMVLVVLFGYGTFLISAQSISLNTANPTSPTRSENERDSRKDDATDKETKDTLILLLLKKGLLDENEAKNLSVSNNEQRDNLAKLLVKKGIIDVAELESVSENKSLERNNQNMQAIVKTVSTTANEKIVSDLNKPITTTTQSVIPAIAPIRVLQLEGIKRDGLIPDLKLGSGAKIKFYGMYRTAVVWDSSNPPGNDFPLPGFLQDSGPNGSPQFHLKARALRLGANFEWLDPSPKTTLTGKIELDFEGDFPRTNNRNIASIRSSQPSLRLAWVRIDRNFDEKRSGYILFGQDWTPFASSTMPQSIEVTGFHLSHGNIYQRNPQVRTGVNFRLSKNRNVSFQPEFAIVLPLFGNMPSNVSDQLGFGERQGVDSNRPELQGRFVLQFQLDKADGVAPAQLISSWTYGTRKAIVPRANVPTAFLSAFPNGAEVESNRYGYTGEFQLPTRWFTTVGKYYRGADLRGYFAGQLYSIFNDTAGLTGTATASSIDGSSTVVFGYDGTEAVVASQRPIRAQGGFINLGFPLSSWFKADSKGRNAGWTAYLNYGFDEAFAKDTRRLGAGRTKSDVFMGNLQYRMNAFITFAYELSYFRTRANNQTGALPLLRGIPSRATHNIRSEFATIFTF